jgi:hypothetical protein
MAISNKMANENLRTKYLEKIAQFLYDMGEEVLRVKSNEIAFPVVDCNDEEKFVVVNFKVPTGANKGLEPYDGYAEAESFEIKCREKMEKAKANAEKKKHKMERDAEIRRKKKEIAEKGE